jgi:transposase InsO family protein
MDIFSRKIVGWAMRDNMLVELVSAALTMAINQQCPHAFCRTDPRQTTCRPLVYY